MPSALLPDLTDLQAATKVEELLIAACEGLGTDAADQGVLFKTFRRNIRESDLKDVIPAPIAANRDLQSFWGYIKKFDPQWAPRRQHIREEFTALIERLEERERESLRVRTDSSSWTGRRSPEVQARVVRSLVPNALNGLEELIERLEGPLHNGGPRDPELADTLAQLRVLHDELGELLRLSEGGMPLEAAIGKVQSLGRGLFRWSSETYCLTLSGLPLATSSTALACGVMTLLHAVTKGAVGLPEAATIGAVAGAGVVAGANRKGP